MGDVIQLPTGPRAPYFLLAWDLFSSTCRLDFVHRGGAREYIGEGKDYLSVRDASQKCANEAGLQLVDRIDPVKWMRRSR